MLFYSKKVMQLYRNTVLLSNCIAVMAHLCYSGGELKSAAGQSLRLRSAADR